jgi:ribosomal protein S18 acetylase RimI-like enzyme
MGKPRNEESDRYCMTDGRHRAFWLTPASRNEALVQQIISLHSAVLREDLTAMLSLKFRIAVFSRLVEEADCIVAMEGSKLVGFCILSDEATLRDAFLGGPIALFSSLLKLALSHPARFFEFLHATLNSSLNKGELFMSSKEIFSFAVAIDKQSQGIGSEIISAARDRYGLGGIMAKTSDPRAARFYQKNGFEVIGEETRGKRKFQVLLTKSVVCGDK